ncbi:partial pyruvate dehydrogenase E2 component (dihydrolipoamide acetyltransferase), partial [Methylococcales bacterium]
MTTVVEIKVPDVGNVPSIDVVEVTIQAGDIVALEQTVAVLETDKASMELPSTAAGTVQQVFIKQGDKVSEGSLIATVLLSDTAAQPVEEAKPTEKKPEPVAETPAPIEKAPEKPKPVVEPVVSESNDGKIPHATPSVRLFARELGVDLNNISKGSGRKGRILREDVTAFVKKALTEPSVVSGGAGIPSIPAIDFSVFGETENIKLSKIKRLTGQNLTRVWLNLPLVTYHEEIDITEMEAFRVALNAEKAKGELKITGLIFIIKALVATLKQFPSFNASLSPDGESLILKKYYNIGIAVDTPNGLVVPVLKDVDKKSLGEIAQELAEKSEKARLGKLMPADMQGGCMSISSLGGIGGTAFTPIANAPEVAILGVT